MIWVIKELRVGYIIGYYNLRLPWNLHSWITEKKRKAMKRLISLLNTTFQLMN